MTEAEKQDARKAAKKANASETLTLEMLVREHASAVLGLCIIHVKNFHDGEDIMQDVFLRAFTRIDTLRDHITTRVCEKPSPANSRALFAWPFFCASGPGRLE